MKNFAVYYDTLTAKAYWFVVVNFFLVTGALHFSPDLLSLLAEDSLSENLGALFLFLTSLVLGTITVQTFKNRNRLKEKDFRWVLFGLATVAFFWAAGEEISWGQRILGIATPEYLSEVNRQHEMNLHNLNTRFFNNALETIMLLLIFVPTVLFHFNIKRVLKIKVPSFQIILAFQMIFCFKTYNYVKDQDYLAYVVLAYWLWVMYKRNDKKGIALILLNTLIITVVGFSNHNLQDRLPNNGTREFREYLFSFMCVIYSVYLWIDTKKGLKTSFLAKRN